MPAVEATEQFGGWGGEEAAPPTLGEVLYANRAGPLVLEREWVSLVQAVAKGDQLALHALYERAHRIVFTISLRVTGGRETAEEVTLDVFHDVWRRASTYDPANGTVLGWIMNQARSRAIDRVRFETRKKRMDPGRDELAGEEAADGAAILHLKQQSAAVRKALEVLTEDERRA